MKRKFKPWYIFIILIAYNIIFLGGIIIKNNISKPIDTTISESGIQRICELATLDCYYHNADEWEKSANRFGYGAKKLWIEYDGMVRVGINGDKIKISEPDNNVITVTVPDAIILGDDFDESSCNEIDCESPLWHVIPLYNSVNTADRQKALDEAQEKMVESASNNRMILDEAKERAKKIIEKNILAIGEASGIQYTVKFVDEPEMQADSSEEETS